MKRPQKTFKESMCVSNFFAGILFLPVGLLGFAGTSEWLQVAFCVLTFAILAYDTFCKVQKPSKEEKASVSKAYSSGYLVMLLTLIVVSIVEHVIGADFSLGDVTSVCIGTSAPAAYMVFRVEELLKEKGEIKYTFRF